jgi:hypothetical protein
MRDGKRPKKDKVIRSESPLDFETFVRAAMQTGNPPAQNKKAAKRRPRKRGK